MYPRRCPTATLPGVDLESKTGCAPPMNLVVNGEKREVPAAGPVSNVEALLAALGIPRERVAVELNGDIVTKAERASKSVKDGDVLEIVTLVGGG